MSKRWGSSLRIGIAIVCLRAAASEAVEPEEFCESGKLKTTGKYAACLLSAEAKSVKSGGSTDVSKCDSKFAETLPRFEAKVGPGVCPTEGGVPAIAGAAKQAAEGLAIKLKKPPGLIGKGRLVTAAAAWWKDTDGVKPRQAGCHQAYALADCGGNQKATGANTRIGEKCVTYNGDNTVLVETNPGAGECHEHERERLIGNGAVVMDGDIVGHPYMYSCNGFCQGHFNVAGTCQPVAGRCGPNNPSARCVCTGVTTTITTPLTTTTTTTSSSTTTTTVP